MTETPDCQPDIVVDVVHIAHDVPIAIERSDGSGNGVDFTSAKRWENPDGSAFALVTWEEGGVK